MPNVFIKGTSIGGGSETAELYQSGRLTEMLQEQGIIKWIYLLNFKWLHEPAQRKKVRWEYELSSLL